ncbi:Spc97/Spc98 family protein [Histoplasma capsulatum H143]|nr:Spc97/Spc98 family protein [Histoplasma capsulatum H143]
MRDSRPGTAASAASQREISAATFQPSNLDKPKTQKENQRPQHDPETITAAHRAHLISIIQSVFLTDVPFTRTLRTLLNAIDHFIAMIIRLETVQQNLDLETDEGVVDSLADYAAEDKRIMHDLRLARAEVHNNVSDLISRLRDIDDNRLGDGKRPFDLGQINVVGNTNGDGSINMFGEGASAFVPWKPAGVDQLLMKLDFFSSSQKSDVDGFEFEAPLT